MYIVKILRDKIESILYIIIDRLFINLSEEFSTL